MQQVRHLVAVMNIGRGNAGAVDQATGAIYADVQFHPEVPLVTLLDLMHLRITGLVLVLDRGRRGNQGGIHNRPIRELHPVRLQQLTDLGEHGSAQVVGFEQMPEVKQCPGIGDPLFSQVKAAELTEHGDIVEGIFTRFIGEVESVGNAVHAQHSFQPNRRPTIPRFGVMRFNQRTEFSPRHQSFHARQKLRLARRAAVLLKSRYCQRRLLHPVSPCVNVSLSDTGSKNSFTVIGTYSVFP